MTKKKSDKQLEKYLRGDSPVSRTYRRSAREQSPPDIDAVILAEARRAVGAPRRGWAPFGAAWAVPISAAAVVVLSVALVVFMAREGVTPTAPAEAPSPESFSVESRRAVDAVEEKVASVAKEKKSERAAATSSDAPATTAGAPAAAPPAPAQEPKSALSEETAFAKTSRASKPATVATGASVRIALADVVSVTPTGTAGAYRFNVSIKSPDTGCNQYADWWEVVGEDGRLLYRHVLLHSHISEQPFTREGGPVPLQPDTVVWVRAHMHPAGYGGVAFKGSPGGGFQMAELNPTFAAALAKSEPLPKGCDF